MGLFMMSPHYVTAFLVRGYRISGHKAPPPVLRTILCIDIINDAMSQRSFVRTCRSTLAVRDMVAGYETSEAKAKCPEYVIYPKRPSGRREKYCHSTPNQMTVLSDFFAL